MIRRRPILRTAAVGGVAYAAGSHAAARSAEQAQMEAGQNAQIAELQQQQAASQQQPVAPPPAATYQQPVESPSAAVYQQPTEPPSAAASEPSSSTTPGTLEQLKLLGELHASNVLTDDEFEAAKQKILNQL
jgi:hypothetical protein